MPPRRVIVTGASSGLGQAIATCLHRSGFTVFGTSRAPAQEKAPAGYAMLAMDVTDEASVAQAIDAVVARAGGLDAVISNAGMGIAGSLEETSVAEAQRQFDTNFFGNHRVVRAALPHLRRQPLAHLVMIGSIAGLIGVPFQGMYSATKFALEGYCEALRLELRGGPVKASLLEPGDFATGFTSARQRIAAATPDSPYHTAFEGALRVIEREERDGADPALMGEAVLALLADTDPPVRRAVTGPAQAGLGRIKQEMSEAALEQMLADWFSGDGAASLPQA